jgi:hypothetical protein
VLKKSVNKSAHNSAPPALRLDPQNARLHPEKNKALIRQSLEEVGAFRSIGVDGEGIVRAGNGVYEAAQALGIRVRMVDAKPNELIAVRRPDLKGEKAVRAALLDNRTGELSEWDPDILGQLESAGLLQGLSMDEFVKAAAADLEEGPVAKIDKAAQLQVKWKTEPGQLWQIGEHRLLCGDSARESDVVRVLHRFGAALRKRLLEGVHNLGNRAAGALGFSDHFLDLGHDTRLLLAAVLFGLRLRRLLGGLGRDALLDQSLACPVGGLCIGAAGDDSLAGRR